MNVLVDVGGMVGVMFGLEVLVGPSVGAKVAKDGGVNPWEVGPDVAGWESGMGVTSGLLPTARVGAAVPGAVVGVVWGVCAWTDATSKTDTSTDKRERIMVEWKLARRSNEELNNDQKKQNNKQRRELYT